MQMSANLFRLRQKLWHAYAALARTLRPLRRAQPMVHGSWVLTRIEAGKDRIYSVPKDQRARVRRWALEYRRYQRARAALAKAHPQLLALADQMAEQRLWAWPKRKEPPNA